MQRERFAVVQLLARRVDVHGIADAVGRLAVLLHLLAGLFHLGGIAGHRSNCGRFFIAPFCGVLIRDLAETQITPSRVFGDFHLVQELHRMAPAVRVVIAETQRQRAVVITHGAPMIIFVCLIIFVYLFAVHQKLCLALQILRVGRKGIHDHNFFFLAGSCCQRHTVAQALISHILIRHRAVLIVSIAFIRRDLLFKGIETGIGIPITGRARNLITVLSYIRGVQILPRFAVCHLVPVFVRSDGQFHFKHRKVLDRNFEGTGPCRIVRH